MKHGISLFAGVLLASTLLFSCSDSDNDNLSEFEICQEECGGACTIPLEDQLCGDDGLLYCNKCELECAGAKDMEGMMVGCSPEEGDSCSREGALATNATEAGGICTCSEGKWSCTTDFEELWGDCPEKCDELCEVNKDMPCGADGALYCNLCVMECRGVKEADDPAVCTTGQSECIDTPKLVWDGDFCNGCSCYPAVSGPHFSCTGMECWDEGPHSEKLTFSGCQENEGNSEPEVTALFNSDTKRVEIEHRNTPINRCAKSVDANLWQDEDKQWHVTYGHSYLGGESCEERCPMTLTYEIVGLEPGSYHIEFHGISSSTPGTWADVTVEP